MAKISAKKLRKKLDAINYNKLPYMQIVGAGDTDSPKKITDRYRLGAYEMLMHIRDTIIDDMEHEAKAKKKADKDVGGWRHRQLERNIDYAYAIRSNLTQTSTILSSGKGKKIYSVGDVIPIMYLGKPVDFDIVEVADHGIKLISHDILAFQPFDINGSNVYDKSSIKDYLENEFEKCFDAEFIKLLNGNKFYLAAEDEIIKAYPEQEQKVKRYKEEPWWYWTGTPSAFASNAVRTITTGGNLYSLGAVNTGGIAPAVIIGRLD